jgi:hypothetical protein
MTRIEKDRVDWCLKELEKCRSLLAVGRVGEGMGVVAGVRGTLRSMRFPNGARSDVPQAKRLARGSEGAGGSRRDLDL